jgi:hypothetical protein
VSHDPIINLLADLESIEFHIDWLLENRNAENFMENLKHLQTRLDSLSDLIAKTTERTELLWPNSTPSK